MAYLSRDGQEGSNDMRGLTARPARPRFCQVEQRALRAGQRTFGSVDLACDLRCLERQGAEHSVRRHQSCRTRQRWGAFHYKAKRCDKRSSVMHRLGFGLVETKKSENTTIT